MAILLHNGSSAGLFDRLGLLGGVLNDVNSFRGGTATTNVIAAASILTRYANAETYWAATSNIQKLLDGLFSQVTNFQASQAGLLTAFQTLAANTLVQMANDDTPLASRTVANAMALLTSQMVANANTVNATTAVPGAQTAVGSPTGDNVLLVSAKNGKGLTIQYPFNETLALTCTKDAQAGATKWQESFTLAGTPQVSDTLSHLWPGGSGTSTNFTSVDCDQNQVGTVLQNGGFETWTNSNYPDNWVIATGTAGGTVFKETTAVYKATNSAGNAGASLKIAGDGATLVTLRQPFNQTPGTSAGAGGTSYKLLPDTVYHCNYWYKLSGASPATGVLRVALVDGSNAVLSDDASTAASNIVTLTGIGDTNWHNVSFAVRTPANMSVATAGNYKLEFKLTTALENGKNLFIDCAAMNAPAALYAGGPYASVFSGGTAPLLGDAWTLALAVTLGGFQKLFERFFGMRNLGFQLNNSGGPSIPDSYIA